MSITKGQSVLLVGDIIILALVTMVGFATHGELGSPVGRMLATFIPMTAAWLCVAPFLGVYNLSYTAAPRHLWRPFWAMVLAAPLGGLLRAIWLQSVVIPLFIIALGGFSTISILAWRVIYLWLTRPGLHRNG